LVGLTLNVFVLVGLVSREPASLPGELDQVSLRLLEPRHSFLRPDIPEVNKFINHTGNGQLLPVGRKINLEDRVCISAQLAQGLTLTLLPQIPPLQTAQIGLACLGAITLEEPPCASHIVHGQGLLRHVHVSGVIQSSLLIPLALSLF